MSHMATRRGRTVERQAPQFGWSDVPLAVGSGVATVLGVVLLLAIMTGGPSEVVRTCLKIPALVLVGGALGVLCDVCAAWSRGRLAGAIAAWLAASVLVPGGLCLYGAFARGHADWSAAVAWPVAFAVLCAAYVPVRTGLAKAYFAREMV
jgi:hypothetical protein